MKLQDGSLIPMEDEEEEEIIINHIGNSDGMSMSSLNEDETADLPTSLIITNLDVTVFENDESKNKFEALFNPFENGITFQYFKSFRRARVNFISAQAAAKARIQIHQITFIDKSINCYFCQSISPSDTNGDRSHLQPPKPTKQFLISPPASPPVGWEPVDEGEPRLNYDLLTAITSLAPGEAHEVHPPSGNHPGIVVHVAEATGEDEPRQKMIRVPPTPRPKS